MPNVLRPSSAWLPCCCAVALSTGASGSLASPLVTLRVCHKKSCSRFSSFLVKSKILACSMTSRRSPTRPWPSEESLVEGLDRALDAIAEFKATSICLFWEEQNQHQVVFRVNCLRLTDGTLPFAKAGNEVG